MKSVLRTLAALCLLSGAISAQLVPVHSQIGLGNGNSNSGKNYLHWELYNCGANYPVGVDASGNPQTVVSRTFDIVANAQGIAQGTAMPNDRILCGGIASTQWKVSVLSAQGQPIAGPQRYFVCSSTASGFCSQIAGAGSIFDVSLAQIAVADPPAPGYIQLFGNSRVNQFWTQPTGTTAFFRGTFDFSGANLIGITGGGGGGGISSVTGSSPIVVTTGSAPVISIQKSDATHDGYVSSTDWNTFNSKGLGSVTSVGITVPQGLAVSGCPITSAGTCAITLNGQFPVSSLGTGAPSSTNFLNGSGAWQSAVTFGGVPFLQVAAGTNITGSVTSNILTLNSTSAVTYPIAAPEGSATAPQYSFALHPEIGLASVLGTGSVNPIRSVQVTGPSGPGNIILTVSSPINTFRWSIGDTFQIASLPATNSLNTLNSITFTATAVGQTTPNGTVTFSATTSVANGTYAVTQGSVSNWDLSIDAHTSVFNRLKSSTANSSRTGTMQGARRDAWKFRSGAIDDTGIDIAALRGAKQNSPANAIGAGIITSSGTNNSGASSITVAKGAGADWSATTADYILIDQPDANGEADLQMYQVRTNTTVTQGTTTSLPVTPNLRTNISAGALIVASWARTQVGDASGVRVVGVLELTDTANYPDGCLTIASGLVTSTGLTCGGSGASDGAAGRLQISGGSGAFTSDSNLTWDSTNVKVTIGTLAIQGKSTVPNQASFTNGAQACTLPGAGKSAWCFDTDGFFKVSEGNGAYFRPGNGAGSGNVVIQGSPSAGQTAEWSDGTHIQGVSPTGTGSYVKGTAPTIAGGLFDVLKDTSGHAGLTLVATASAVDSLQVISAATANPATVALQAIGSDSNINVNIISKGTGVVLCNGIACGGGSSSYTNLFQSDANTLTQRNSTVTQAYQVMATYTDAANFNGVEIGGNYIKTTRQGTGVSGPFRFGVDSNGISFRGWQVLTGSLTLAPFNTVSAPDIGTTANRAGVLWAGSADFSGAITVSITNEGVTGTTLNKLAKLTGAPSTAVIAGTSDVFGIAGIVTSGAGITSASTLAYSGTASCVFDAGTTANHYVIPSTTVAGDCHDSGVATSVAPPTSVQVIGAVQSTNVAAGTYAVLLGFEVGGGAGGGSGTLTSLSTSGGAPLFSSVVNNATTTPQIVFTPSNAAANTVYANFTGSSAPPTFGQPMLTSSLFSNQGTTVQVLHGNATGNLTFAPLNFATDGTGNIPITNICSGTGAGATTVLFGDCTWRVPSGGGNVATNGTITTNTAAEWATTTSLRSVTVTGSGNYVKATAPILNNPSIASIKDGNGAPAIDFVAAPGAVDYLGVSNSATGASPGVTLDARGADPNIDLILSGKGTGRVKSNGPVVASGVTGYYFGPEGPDPGLCSGSSDGFYASQTNAYLTMCNHGGQQQKIIGSSSDINTSDQVVGAHFPTVRAGDLFLNNGAGWAVFGGNNSGSKFLIEDANGVASWSAGTSAVPWSALQTSASDLNVSMTGFVSNFNYTSGPQNAFAWINTTAATVSTSQSSPALGLQGNGWNGSASIPLDWQLRNVIANGTNGSTTLDITSNSANFAIVQVPALATTTPTALSALEGVCSAVGVAGRDVLCPDSTLHWYKMVNNNGTAVPVVGGPSGGSTSGNLAAFSGTGGNLLQDTGIAFGNVVSAASNYVNGELIQAAGANKTTSSSGIAANTVVTAAAITVSGNLLQGNGARGASDSAIAANTVLTAAANFTVGHVVCANGNDKTTVDCGFLGTNIITDASNGTTHGVAVFSGSKTLTTTAAGTSGLPLVSGGASADPTYVALGLSGGGTGGTSQSTAAIAILPTATRAGDVLYWDGSIWNHLAGNNSGTNFLQENSSGVPSWAAGSSAVALSAVTAAAGANTLANGDNAQVWNWALTTAGKSAFTFGETTAATSTGTPYLVNIQTLAASTANPLVVTALGTANGVQVLKSGFFTTKGTGGVDSNLLHCDVTDTTKCFQFVASGITTATTRSVTIANGASTTIIADTGASNNFLTAISASGVISKAQPAIANLSDGANIVTAGSAAGAANQVALSNGADKTLKYATADSATTHAMFATAGAPAFRAIVTGDLPAALASQTSINGLAITASTGTLAIANGKTLTNNNTLTITATDGITMTTPTTSFTVARTDAANTFTGNQTMTALLATASTAVTQSNCDNSTKIATTAFLNTPCTNIQASGSPLTLTGNSGYYYNDTASAYTFQLDAPVLGKQYCFGNRKARSSAITIKSLASVTIYYKGVAGTTGTSGTLVSAGAVGDFVCVVGTDTTTYEATGAGQGTWTNN